MAKGDVHVTFLLPKMSKNKRLYTRENIGKAVSRMQERIASSEGLPITMNTSHRATLSGDVTKTAAYVKRVWQEDDGRARGIVRLVDTEAGRDVGALLKTDEDGHAALKGVSIFGRWVGPVRHENGGETADDLEVTGIDFTHYPGVEGAGVDAIESAAAEMAAAGIFGESFEEGIFMEDDTVAEIAVGPDGLPVSPVAEATDPKKPYGNVPYADRGYQKDGKYRYPLDKKKHIRAAWDYINVAKNARKYSPNQLARVKSRIKAAAKKFGIDVQEEHELFVNVLEDALEQLPGEVLEAYASMCMSNNAGSISASGYVSGSKELHALADRIATAAKAGMTALDPDEDDDVDVSTADESCEECDSPLAEGDQFCPSCGHQVSEAAPPTTRKEGAMPEFTKDQVAALVGADKAAALTQESYTDAEVRALLESAPEPAPKSKKTKLTAEQLAGLKALGINAESVRPKKVKLTQEQKLERARKLLEEAEAKKGSAPVTAEQIAAMLEERDAKLRESLQEAAVRDFRATPARKGLMPLLESLDKAMPSEKDLAEMSLDDLFADYAANGVSAG